MTSFIIPEMDPERALIKYLAFGDGPFSNCRGVRELALVEWEQYRGWGDLYLDWVAEDAAAESATARAERLAREEAEAAEKARLEPMIELHHNQQRAMVARSRNARTKDRVGFKDARPCRALYDFSREAGCCQTRHLSTECWAHEFTDGLSSEFLDARGTLTPMANEYGIPRALKDGSARIKRNQEGILAVVWTPHTCWMTHPDEPAWNPVWNDDRNAQPAPPPPPPRNHHNTYNTHNTHNTHNTYNQQRQHQPQRQSGFGAGGGNWRSEPQNSFTGPRRDFAAVRAPAVTKPKPVAKGGFSALDYDSD
jgi:hypothetical protein